MSDKYDQETYLDEPIRCPECGWTGSLDDVNVMGANEGNGFCPDCHAEFCLDH